MIEKYFDIACDEALIGCEIGEVPVGCVIVCDDKIIAKAHNLKEYNNDATAHAEILAIKEASSYLNDWRLNNCTLYTTVKPCPMCMGAIKESRIARVFYLVESDNIKKYYSDLEMKKFEYRYDESLYLLKTFFKSKR